MTCHPHRRLPASLIPSGILVLLLAATAFLPPVSQAADSCADPACDNAKTASVDKTKAPAVLPAEGSIARKRMSAVAACKDESCPIDHSGPAAKPAATDVHDHEGESHERKEAVEHGPASDPHVHEAEAATDEHAGHDHEGEAHERNETAEHDHAAHAVESDHSDHEDHAEHEGEADSDGHEGHDHTEFEAIEHRLTVTEETLSLYTLRMGRVERATPMQPIQAPARVSYNLEAIARVSTPVEGRVVEIPVRLGDSVERGDALLRVHSPLLGEAQNDLLQRRAELDSATVAWEVARTDLDRARRLRDGQGISEAEFLRREGEFKKADGAVRSARASVRAAENKLSIYGYTKDSIDALAASGEIDPVYVVHAPIDGQVIERRSTVGQVVAPASEPLMMLADLSTWWVVASVAEAHAAHVRIGAPARVTIDALAGETLEGTVAYVAPLVDEVSRAAQVRIDVANGHLPLRAGMFGHVDFLEPPRGADEAALVVPRSAVWSIDRAPYVFVPSEEDRLTFRAIPVTVGSTLGGLVAVKSGLGEGDRIVAEGGFILKADLNKSRAKACCEH